MELSLVVTIFGILVAVTNAIVQVTKKATWDKLPTNLLALIVAIVLTLVVGLAYLQITGVIILWYMVAALIVAGWLVAYAAMFGFDKLREILNQWPALQTILETLKKK